MRNRHVIQRSFRTTGARGVGGKEIFDVPELNYRGIFVILRANAPGIIAPADLQRNNFAALIFVDGDGGFGAEIDTDDTGGVHVSGWVARVHGFAERNRALAVRRQIPQIPVPAIRVAQNFRVVAVKTNAPVVNFQKFRAKTIFKFRARNGFFAEKFGFQKIKFLAGFNSVKNFILVERDFIALQFHAVAVMCVKIFQLIESFARIGAVKISRRKVIGKPKPENLLNRNISAAELVNRNHPKIILTIAIVSFYAVIIAVLRKHISASVVNRQARICTAANFYSAVGIAKITYLVVEQNFRVGFGRNDALKTGELQIIGLNVAAVYGVVGITGVAAVSVEVWNEPAEFVGIVDAFGLTGAVEENPLAALKFFGKFSGELIDILREILGGDGDDAFEFGVGVFGEGFAGDGHGGDFFSVHEK